MGWDCMVALAKAKQRFGAGPQAMANALAHRGSTADPTSCATTMELLSETICPARGITSHGVKGGQGQFVPQKAIDEMRGLVTGDDAIFVSIAPDHHFTVLPIDDTEVAILQGFQDSYGIDEWINESGKIPMRTSVFLDNFAKLFSADAGTRVPAAIILFATPKTVEDIAGYFGHQASFVKSLSSASPNLFKDGDKAELVA